jgi:glycosyltransferase involved in cell wall biosynthesis
MKFSLVLATVGRTDELILFLNSLTKQGDIDLELIVVDQNQDDRLVPILANYQTIFSILHFRSEKGLSKARNIGLKHVTGDIVAFPDDDCEYPEHLLSYALKAFCDNSSLDGLTGRSITGEGLPSVGRFDPHPGKVDKTNVWLRGISMTIFFRTTAISKIFFDESFGIGAKWGSGEETDFLLQVLAKGANIVYDPNLKVIHPPPPTVYTPQLIQKEFKYGLGMGRVVQKYNYPLWFKGKILVRPLGGLLFSLVKFKISRARAYLYSFLGRLQGLIAK